MKVVRYELGGVSAFGELLGDKILPLEGALPDFTRSQQAPLSLADVRLLAPVLPSKVICIGPGYKAVLRGNPLPRRPFLWMKPLTAMRAQGDAIVIPQGIGPVNHESELAIVIGREASHVSPDEAIASVFGYTCANDVTAGDMSDGRFRQSEWFTDGKIFDSFFPLGPHVETELDPDDLQVRCWVNGKLRQEHRTSDRIWPYAELIAHISRTMTLKPGDVISTGSIPGPAPLMPGDVVEVEVEGIGRLMNPVVAGSDWIWPNVA